MTRRLLTALLGLTVFFTSQLSFAEEGGRRNRPPGPREGSGDQQRGGQGRDKAKHKLRDAAKRHPRLGHRRRHKHRRHHRNGERRHARHHRHKGGAGRGR